MLYPLFCVFLPGRCSYRHWPAPLTGALKAATSCFELFVIETPSILYGIIVNVHSVVYSLHYEGLATVFRSINREL